jgi:phage FluMu protein gp41
MLFGIIYLNVFDGIKIVKKQLRKVSLIKIENKESFNSRLKAYHISQITEQPHSI